MTYYRCSCTHVTQDHAGHGHAECLIDPCPCQKMIPTETYVPLKKVRPKSDELFQPKALAD